MTLSDAHFNSVANYFNAAMFEAGVHLQDINEINVILASLKSKIVTRSMYQMLGEQAKIR